MDKETGEIFCGVSDMTVLEEIPKAHLEDTQFWKSDIVLMDANICPETMEFVLSKTNQTKHVIFEPLSCEKAAKILSKDFLGKLTCIKPNLSQLKLIIKKIS